MIEVCDLSKSYGSVAAVDGISFSVESGKALGFLGPNGAGKTTTMRIITGFMPASSGTVTVDGFDVFDDSFEVRRRIGYLPEHPPLYLEMAVRSYLVHVARLKGIRGAAARDAADSVIVDCSLAKVADRLCGHLSKGYRQRVGLAQALIHKPEVLVLDEPTVGLDPAQIIEIRQLIRRLAAERTVILSTHILPEVAQICEKVVIINEGRVALEADLSDLPAGRSLEEEYMRHVGGEAHGTAPAPRPAATDENTILEDKGDKPGA
jgi:ABC-2 type transport system ATP-binding protein